MSTQAGAVGPDQPVILPRPPGFLRREMRAHPQWVDGIIVVIYLLMVAVLSYSGFYSFNPDTSTFDFDTPQYLRFPHIVLLVLIVLVTLAALILRRRFPLSSLIATVAVSALANDEMVPALATTGAICVLLYSVPVYRSVRAGWVGYGVAVVASIAPAAVMMDVVQANEAAWWISLIISALLMMIPVMIGVNAGNRRRYLDSIIDRAHQLARERDQLARLAVAEERSRIAREMHDIVAHSLSVMITLSEGAARITATQPEEATRAMVQSAETGRTALGEMRRMIGVLRGPDTAEPEMAPMPGIDEIPELIDGFRAAGMTVSLILDGKPSDLAKSEQSQELAVYRVVQEALTNALRYAGPGAEVSVEITQRPEAVDVRIVDNGGIPGSERTMSNVGSGQGLAGLTERVRVYGGILDFGPTPAGGWHVTANLPQFDVVNPEE